jgi:hypothetical protein
VLFRSLSGLQEKCPNLARAGLLLLKPLMDVSLRPV